MYSVTLNLNFPNRTSQGKLHPTSISNSNSISKSQYSQYYLNLKILKKKVQFWIECLQHTLRTRCEALDAEAPSIDSSLISSHQSNDSSVLTSHKERKEYKITCSFTTSGLHALNLPFYNCFL
jgi:hypothetical protein